MTRRYEISYLDANGQVQMETQVAPAIAEFEEAFSAFARGTVIATGDGPVAVEDLAPGMQAVTGDGSLSTITWIGSMSVFPARSGTKLETSRMMRITADTFGPARPQPDLLLGPRARILMKGGAGRAAAGASAAYVPVRGLLDGVSIIEVTPIAPVTAYHLVLERHGSIRTAGLEIESFNPGPGLSERLDPQLAAIFLTLFPQLRSLADFSPLAHPRLSEDEMELAIAN